MEGKMEDKLSPHLSVELLGVTWHPGLEDTVDRTDLENCH